MPGDPSSPDPGLDPRTLWQSQPPESPPMTLADIRKTSRAFQSRVRRRNLIEYVAGAVGALGFLPAVFDPESWMVRAGGVLAIAGMAVVGWQLHRRGSARGVPEAGEALTAFHRAELIRQRDAVRSVAVWYLAPPIPGMILLLLGRWFQAPAPHRSATAHQLAILAVAAVVGLVFLAIWWLNQRVAHRLQRQIDQLPPPGS